MPQPPFDVLVSKVRVPAVPPGSVSRTGLVNRLRATSASSLVVVAAPAGYGKTTLLAQWAMREERPFTWMSVDRRDNDPLILLRHIAVALGNLGPLDPTVLSALESSDEETIWRVALPRLGAAVAAQARPFVMVLDDADMLESQDSLDAMTALAEQMPAGATLVLAGRAQPSLGIARLRAHGRLLEIGPDMLALTCREAQLLLRAAGVELAEPQVAELVTRTEGWPAGLYLTALTLRGRDDEAAQPAGITGEVRYVSEYLRAEHLSQLDPDTLAFLRRSSVLGKMCGSLCDAVLETEASAAKLESLLESNVFLVPLDDRCEWYRYHRLFEDMLRRDQLQADALAIPELNRRAADWYEAHGQPESALEPAAESGDVDRAARLFGSVALTTYHEGRLSTIEGWLDHFAEESRLARHPAVGVLGSWVHAIRGRPDAADRWLRATERGSDAGPLPDGSASARPWIAILRAAMCRDGVGQMEADAAEALVELPGDSPLRPAALLIHGAAHVLLGCPEEGDAILSLAADEAMRLDAADTLSLAVGQRALVASARGDHAGADMLAREARTVASRNRLGDYPTMALGLALGARAHLRQGRWDDARADMAKACELAQAVTYGMPWLAVEAQLEVARAHVTLREADAAWALLTEIGALLERHPGLGVLPVQADELCDRVRTMPAGEGRTSGLTSAELRVLPLLQTHLSFREIGERQFVSRNTIKTQAISIYRKLGVSSRSAAIERAEDLGLIDAQTGPVAAEFIRSG